MELKTTPALKVIYFTAKTSLEELEGFVLKVAEDLYSEIAKKHLIPAGPQYWIYHGMDGKPETIFTLEICVPVNGQPKETPGFLYKELVAFKCVSEIHNGSWDKLSGVYATVIPAILAQNKKLTGSFREMYINIDFENPGNNITEVQIGIY